MNLNSLNARWTPLIGLIFLLILCYQTVVAQTKVVPWNNSNPDKKFVWHPEAIHIEFPTMKFDFELPYEEDQSGVANLFFRDRESNKVYMLDSLGINPFYKSKLRLEQQVAKIRDARYYTKLNVGNYDAILLYNSGKYIVYDNIIFEENSHRVINMKGLSVFNPDSESRKWLILRKFNTVIGKRVLHKNYRAVSKKKVLGYIFFQESQEASDMAIVTQIQENGHNENKIVMSSYDGYFELDIDDDIDQTLEVSSLGGETKRIRVRPNSGIFIVLKAHTYSEEELNITTGSLVKKRK